MVIFKRKKSNKIWQNEFQMAEDKLMKKPGGCLIPLKKPKDKYQKQWIMLDSTKLDIK